MSVVDDLILYAAIGFAAQLVDGAIGMAYGLTATSVLMSFGVGAATASASVHAAEVVTTAASGTAHWRLGNYDRRLVWKLAVPGMIGGTIGAYAVATVPSTYIRPAVSTYLIVMGLIIFWRAVSNARSIADPGRHIGVFGFVGGFLDSAGGGGWGAMVTTTLIGRGVKPRFAIGSANIAEFFVTATVTATFVATIGLALWPVITGLVIGGVIGAPIAAYATKNVPEKPIMIIVAVVVIALSMRNLYLALV